jgi:hypothetical protein
VKIMSKKSEQKFQIYRHAEAPGLMEANCMTLAPFAEKIVPGLMKANEAGMEHGEQVKVLINIPGFSLTHVWFKKHFPLPLHSHDADCLYYIIAGSLRLGTETLGPRDGFFVPCDVPYAYTPGPDGVELLEFRHNTTFNFVNHAKTAEANAEDWKTARRPNLIDA